MTYNKYRDVVPYGTKPLSQKVMVLVHDLFTKRKGWVEVGCSKGYFKN